MLLWETFGSLLSCVSFHDRGATGLKHVEHTSQKQDLTDGSYEGNFETSLAPSLPQKASTEQPQST